jgi:hypothetical protein
VPLDEDTNIKLLQKVVEDQRKILTDVYNGTDVATIPQLWALCMLNSSLSSCVHVLMPFLDKEVQGYYEDGMRVPDDVTLLWTDDKCVSFMLIYMPTLTDFFLTVGATSVATPSRLSAIAQAELVSTITLTMSAILVTTSGFQLLRYRRCTSKCRLLLRPRPTAFGYEDMIYSDIHHVHTRTVDRQRR